MAVRREEVRVTADISNFTTKMAAASAAASGFAKRLDEADSRMSNLVQAGLALAPALVPLGAAVVPAIAGLANELGVAALAAGATVLAFKGVGTAVKALDAYKLAPTAANFAKLQTAMRAMGPAGQEFALFVDKLEPKLRALQAVAEKGLLPGVQDSITTLLPLLPEAQRLIFAVSSTLGNLVSQGAEAVASDTSWTSFFRTLEADSATTLDQMGKTVGHLAVAFRDLFTAFLPQAQSFSAGLLHMSASFEQWAAGLSQTQGFQNFLSYIEKSGPAALHALAAIGQALVGIVEAAAPVGRVALPAITAIAHAISGLADSSVGPIIIATAAAVGVLGRSLALLKTVGLRGQAGGFLQTEFVAPSKGVISSFREMSAASTAFAAAEREAALAHTRYIGTLKASSVVQELIPGTAASKGAKAAAKELVAANDMQAKSAARVAEAERTKADAVRAGAASFGKAAAAGLGLALVTSGLADKTGLANTASLALMGTIAGPWGAAVGGGIGLVKDFAAANNDLEDSLTAANRAAASPTGLVDFASRIGDAQSAFDSAQQSVDSFANAFVGTLGGGLPNPFKDISGEIRGFQLEVSGGLQKYRDQLLDLRVASLQNTQALGELYAKLNHGDMSMIGAPLEKLQGFAQQIAPALQAAGLSFDAVTKHPAAAAAAIRAYDNSLDTATGSSKAVGAALAALGSQMQTNKTQADALKASMDSLFGIQLSESAATDAWIQSLHDLNSALKGTHDTLVGGSKAALENRAAIRTSVSALEDRINAEAAAGASGSRLTNTLIKGRDAIVRQAVAAGASRKQVKAYLDTLGLTPKNLTTIIKADGALTAKQRVQALAKVYRLTPKELKTLVSAAGVEPTTAKIDALAKKYHLTPKQVKTILDAQDKATPKIKAAHLNATNFAKGGYSAKLYALDKASNVTAKAKTNATNFAKGGYSAKLFAIDRASNVTAKAKGNARNYADGNYTAKLAALDRASGTIANVAGELRALNGKVAVTYIETRRSTIETVHRRFDNSLDANRAGANGLFVTAYANGGYTDQGQYVPRVSQMRNGGGNILWSEPETGWEAYISGKPGMRERNLNILTQAADRLGADVYRRYADGGITAFANGGTVGESKRQAKAIHEVTSELSKLAKQIKDIRTQQKKQYASQVAQSFVSDPFAGTLGGFDAQIAYEKKRLSGANADLKTLQRNGIGAGLFKALAASGNATLIDQFAHLSKAQLAARSTAFRTRNNLDRAVGETAANIAYAQQLGTLSGEVKTLTRELHALRTGHHIGSTIINGRVTVKDGGQTRTAAKAKQRARQK